MKISQKLIESKLAENFANELKNLQKKVYSKMLSLSI